MSGKLIVGIVNALVACAVIASPAYAKDGENAAAQMPRPDHIVVVIEENKSLIQIIGNMAARYVNEIAGQGALFTNSYAVSRPSQPNYLALFSGSTHGVTDNQCPLNLSGNNLAAQLGRNGFSFAIYSESLPAIGYAGCISPDNLYARKHNPVVNWQGPAFVRDANMPFSRFPTDYARLPTVSMVVPNLLNDMHDGRTLPDQIAQGDAWLRVSLGPYLEWARTHNSLLILTWDEDDGSGDNHIPTIFVGPMVKSGRYAQRISHYSILRTIEDMYGLPPIGRAAEANPITGAWK